MGVCVHLRKGERHFQAGVRRMPTRIPKRWVLASLPGCNPPLTLPGGHSLDCLGTTTGYHLASLRENGAYIVPKTFLPSRLRRGGWGIVSNRTCRLKRCISFRVACNWRHCAMASANHSNCSLDKATLTVLPLTLRVH